MLWWFNPNWYWWGSRFPELSYGYGGYGYRPFYPYIYPYAGWSFWTSTEEKRMLEDQRNALKRQLEQIEQRLEELEEE